MLAQERHAVLSLPAVKEARVSVLARQRALAFVLMEAPHVLGFRPVRQAVIVLLEKFVALQLAVGSMSVSVQRSAAAPIQLQRRGSFSGGRLMDLWLAISTDDIESNLECHTPGRLGWKRYSICVPALLLFFSSQIPFLFYNMPISTLREVELAALLPEKNINCRCVCMLSIGIVCIISRSFI